MNNSLVSRRTRSDAFAVKWGLLQVVFCAVVLALVLTSTPAWALCRPENRVWGLSEEPSAFASQKSLNSIAASGENLGCCYDFASGMHKYLYCQNDPVMGTDPSGHDELADVSLAGAEGAAIDAEAMPVLSRVYMTTYNALMKVAMNQQQILGYAQATAASLTAVLVGADVMARVGSRLMQNTATIPAGNWSYGQMLEKTALQPEEGYLGGTVSKIDYFNKNSGLAISFKAHGLSSTMPNLGDRLLVAIQRDLQKVSDVKVTGARGVAASGLNVNITGSQIRQTILTVAVPESQAETVLSSTFQQALLEYEQFYETEIEVIPVQGWMR